MAAQVKWHPEAFQARLVEAANAGLTEAAIYIVDQAKQNMGSEGGGVLATTGAAIRNFAGAKPTLKPKLTRKGRQRYIAAPPGAFPGIRLDKLRGSITHATPAQLGTPLRAAYGTNVDYGRFLEFGTRSGGSGFFGSLLRRLFGKKPKSARSMAARPWAMRSAMLAANGAHRLFSATVRTAIARGVSEQQKGGG